MPALHVPPANFSKAFETSTELPRLPNLADIELAELALLDSMLPEKLSQIWKDIASLLLILMARHPATMELGPLVLAELAVAQIDYLGHQLGGGTLYLPNNVKMRTSFRNDALKAKFNGSNHRELAREFGISDMRVSQILNDWRPNPVQRPAAGSADFRRYKLRASEEANDGPPESGNVYNQLVKKT